MAASDYYFETRWRMRASLEEVCALLQDGGSLCEWWPDVYLSVREIEPGVFTLHTRGWLPYTLYWNFKMVETNLPYGFTIQAWGDLEGTGVWTFTPDGEWTNILYQWTVHAHKPLLRYFSFLLKPLFQTNHRWAMARGEESMARELIRRRGLAPVTSS